MQIINTCRTLSHKWEHLYQSPPSLENVVGKDQNACKSQMSGRTGAKWCLLDMTRSLNSWTYSSCGCLYKACTRSSQSKFSHAIGIGSWATPRPYYWEAIDSWYLLGRESQFSLELWSLLSQPCFSGRSYLHAYLGSPIWTHWVI